MNKTVDTRICEVTVYNDQALVTRRGVVLLTSQLHELVIAQLPVTLLSESVRATSAGKIPVRLLGVRTERNQATEAMNQEIVQLNQEIGHIEEQKHQGQDQLTLLNLQRNFVKSLSTQYLERMTRHPNPEPLNLDQIRELMDFIGQQYSDFSSAIAASDKEQKQLDKHIQILRQQLQQRSTSRPTESFSVIVTIEPLEAGEIELEVSYVVNQASWMPLYDLRLSATSEKINIGFLAEVKQSSGEDWQDVALTLSTAKPKLGSLPPKLFPWYIDVQQPNNQGLTTNNMAEPASVPTRALLATMPYPGMAPALEATREAELESLKAQVATAEVSKPGAIITFGVSHASNIPSDGATHKTTIFNEDYPCRVEYIAIPRLVNLAYLQTTIANPLTGVTLLPGKANIFRDNTFIGTTELENIVAGQEFKLNLGIDEGLKIERHLVERQVDQELISNLRRTTYAYQLVITNLRECSAELTLIEQLPVTRNEQIKVRLTLSNPQVQMGEMGILEWPLTLQPLSKHELYYQFTVEHPPELTVFGLDI